MRMIMYTQRELKKNKDNAEIEEAIVQKSSKRARGEVSEV